MSLSHIAVGDGCKIAYRFDGPAHAPVLMMSNSLGTALDMWAPQMAAFTQGFRVLRYDARGHGASDVPLGAYSIDRLGRDTTELLDALKLQRVWFCGLSMGGFIGQWLGVRAPERLKGLVLANTASYMGPPESWQARIGLVMDKGMAALTDAVLERWFTTGFRRRAPDAIAVVRAMLLATKPAGYAGCCAAIRDMDQRPVVRLINTPTLVISGAQDPATPAETTEEIAQAIRGSKIVRLEAAHLSNVEQPEQFAASILEFMRSGS